MTLNYITDDIWWDTDVTILPEVCKKYKVNVFVEDVSWGKQKYPQKEDYGFQKFIRFTSKYHNKDIRRMWGSLKYFKQVYSECRKRGVVNLFILGTDAYLVILLYCLLSKKNSIIAIHNYGEHVDSRNSFFTRFYKLYFRKFKRFLFYSESQQEYFLKDFPDKIAYKLNMPLKDFGVSTQKRKDDKITFLFFGNMRAYKRPDLFIEAANNVPDGNVKFLMVGNGDEDCYRPFIKRKGDFLLDMRHVANEEIPDLFYNSDFLVLPYEDATQSGPLLIAVNYGIPIIASRLPIFERFVTEGENGYLFPVGDANALVNIYNVIIKKGKGDIERMKENMRRRKTEYIKDNNIFEIFNKMMNI